MNENLKNSKYQIVIELDAAADADKLYDFLSNLKHATSLDSGTTATICGMLPTEFNKQFEIKGLSKVVWK